MTHYFIRNLVYQRNSKLPNYPITLPFSSSTEKQSQDKKTYSIKQSRPECLVDRSLAVILHVSRLFGVAPVSFEKKRNSTFVKVSPGITAYSYLLLLGLRKFYQYTPVYSVPTSVSMLWYAITTYYTASLFYTSLSLIVSLYFCLSIGKIIAVYHCP